MPLSWFDTRAVTELGGTLADQLIDETTSAARKRKLSDKADREAIQSFLRRVDREARPLRLNLYKRAKLANSFKWKLLENGLAPSKVDELTQMLLLRISDARPGAATAASTGTAVAPTSKRSRAGKIAALLVNANECASRNSLSDAARLYQEILDLDSRHAVARNNLAATLIKLGRFSQAEQELRRAIEIKHDHPDALSNLATVLRAKGRIRDSETPLRQALKLSPQHVDARVSLGLTLILLGRYLEAKECFDKALKLAPRNIDAWIGAAQIAEIQGRFQESAALLDRALEIDPRSPIAWAAKARLRRMTPDDSAWIERAESIASDAIDPMAEATLRFAIGKYYDDVQDYARAFQSYRRANELQKTVSTSYDRRSRTSFVDDLVRVYTRDGLANREPGGSDSERPVFVVGMMRSGTSLVEQIIASHPDAAGAGELDFWLGAVHKHEASLRRGLPEAQLRSQWAKAYLQLLKGRSPSAALRVVDKSNFNSDCLGIIHLVFPRARIIYVHRDPVDTCLSCYFQQFSTNLDFALDLSDLAHYYREHRRLADHWRAVLPAGRVLEVPYAELVADQERWTRGILDFLGLPWDERCLRFHETDRPVLTASTRQVRQKVYQSSVGRSRLYEKFIGPLRGLSERG